MWQMVSCKAIHEMEPGTVVYSSYPDFYMQYKIIRSWPVLVHESVVLSFCGFNFEQILPVAQLYILVHVTFLFAWYG